MQWTVNLHCTPPCYEIPLMKHDLKISLKKNKLTVQQLELWANIKICVCWGDDGSRCPSNYLYAVDTDTVHRPPFCGGWYQTFVGLCKLFVLLKKCCVYIATIDYKPQNSIYILLSLQGNMACIYCHVSSIDLPTQQVTRWRLFMPSTRHLAI